LVLSGHIIPIENIPELIIIKKYDKKLKVFFEYKGSFDGYKPIILLSKILQNHILIHNILTIWGIIWNNTMAN